MGKLEELKAWKKRWGYDDSYLTTKGRRGAGLAPDARYRSFDAESAEAHIRIAGLLDPVLPLCADKIRRQSQNPDSVNLLNLSREIAKLDPEPEGAKDLICRMKTECEAIRYTDEAADGALLTEARRMLAGKPDAVEDIDDWLIARESRFYDPERAAFFVSAQNRLRDRASVDRTATIDQVEERIYSTDRRAELVGLTNGAGDAGHHLAQSYALRTIETLVGRDDQPGIRNVHDDSSAYQRDSLSGKLEHKMFELYQKKRQAEIGRVGQTEADRLWPEVSATDVAKGKVIFVNSPDIEGKLDRVYGPDWKDPQNGSRSYKTMMQRVQKIDGNLHVMIMNDPTSGDPPLPAFRSRLIEGSGATPSAYEIERLAADDADFDILRDASMLDSTQPRNSVTLAAITTGPGRVSLAEMPTGHPMKQTASAAAQMVEGLQKALSALGDKVEAFEQNKLVKSALDKIGRLMEVMPTYVNDTPRFSRLFDLLVDETYLVLATVKPYDQASYREATHKEMSRRMPSVGDTEMPDVKHKTFMLSSGMGAMSAAVETAFARTGNTSLHLVDQGASHAANYFEVEANLTNTDNTAAITVAPPDTDPYKPPVIMATLNPSTPVTKEEDADRSGWTLEKLFAKVDPVLELHRAKLETATKPAVLIVDATVERDGDGTEQELDKLVVHFKDLVNVGRLEILLNKSYQKYPSLGAGKAMGGGLTVISKTTDEGGAPWDVATAAEASEIIMDNEEAQIVTHFLAHEGDVERQMLTRAADNASFVRGFLGDVITPSKKTNTGYDEGLPFLELPNARLSRGAGVMDDTSGSAKEAEKRMKAREQTTLTYLLNSQGVDPRMSFGFQNTSSLSTSPGMMRLALGQESHEELVEKLYAPLMLALGPDGSAFEEPDKSGKTGTGSDKKARLDSQFKPGNATTDTLKAAAAEAAAKATAQVATALAKEADQPSGTDPASERHQAWRKKMVRALIGAGKLAEAAVSRDQVSNITSPADTELNRLLGEVTGGGADYDAAQMGARIGFVMALQTRSSDALSSDPSLQVFGAEEEDERAKWRAGGIERLRGRGLAPPDYPLAPEGGDKEASQQHLKAMHKQDAELRVRLSQLDNVNTMIAGTERGFDLVNMEGVGMEAAYLPNILSSCTTLTQVMPGGDAAFAELADVLMAKGLDGLSHEARERVLDKRGQIEIATMATGITDDHIDKLTAVAKAFPYGEGAGNLLRSGALQDAIAGKDDLLDADTAGKIAKALMESRPVEETIGSLKGLVADYRKLGALNDSNKALLTSLADLLMTRVAAIENRTEEAPLVTPTLFQDSPGMAEIGRVRMDLGQIALLKRTAELQASDARDLAK